MSQLGVNMLQWHLLVSTQLMPGELRDAQLSLLLPSGQAEDHYFFHEDHVGLPLQLGSAVLLLLLC